MDRRARSRVGRPFDGDGRLRRFAPFAVVALLALFALDLGRMDGAMLAFVVGSVTGLGAAALLPWERLPGWLQPGLAVA